MNLANARNLLQAFDFTRLFVEELGWSNPSSAKPVPMAVKGSPFTRREVAQLSGVVVIEVVADDGAIPDAAGRAAIHKEIAKLHHENVLIFVDAKRSQSLWCWAKRQDRKTILRSHIFVHGQTGDLLLSKLGALAVDFADFDDSGHVPLLEVTDRLKQALDIERVTKKFYGEFQEQHVAFLDLIDGIAEERDRRWYASVLLNRLMFIYFLQKKFFLDGGDDLYLQNKLRTYSSFIPQPSSFYEAFLKALFFEGFAKPEDKRTAEVNALLGKIKYLNGGLFLPHPIEVRWPKIVVPDKAFENLLALFGRYSWNLNDTPGGQDNEINPDVLGYIFEKYINQKAFGAYYTRPEITEYLCERTIHRLILDGVNESGTGVPPVKEDHGQDAHATGLNPFAKVDIRQGAYLPHWTQEDATYAISFRLIDSLPVEVLKQWIAERDDIVNTARRLGRGLSDTERKRLAQLHSEKVEKWLDAGHGSCWLKDDRIAQIVSDAIAHFNGERYDLVAWCIMPNHVHTILRPKAGHELAEILHSWKSFTSKKANVVLNRTGEFWQAEYYDHLIRNEDDYRKQVQYVLGNPLKVGLRDWKWVGSGAGCGTGVPPVAKHGQDGRATKKHGRDAHATFDSVGDLLLALDAPLCKKLLHEVLPNLRLLDPACGSAAFLVSAMKTLINVYAAVIGKIDFLSDRSLQDWLKKTQKEHKSVSYFIKRSIITNNLFGVDIMEEATEIAKLRLFLALVASANKAEDLEPLPNIEFNIMAGNSLIGLMHVDDAEFEKRHPADFFRKSYREVLEEKNELIEVYRRATTYGHDLQELRDNIQARKQAAVPALNDILLGEFTHLGIKYEEAEFCGTGVPPVKTTAKMAVPRFKKRALRDSDIAALKPFHWGYEFDQILGTKGGFDAIITNPPWEIFKPNAKEFFEEYSDLVTKKKMTIKEFEKEQAKLLKDDDTRKAWLKYLSEYPHVSAFYRCAPQYKNQISIVDGKKAGSDTNLYKLFTEQCFNLLRKGGYCGIVIPSGIYTDLGTKQLREMLFGQTRITGLFCFENRKEVFEGVHRSFKFVILTYEKSASGTGVSPVKEHGQDGRATISFPAAFMRHDVAELERFPQEGAIPISIELVRRLSPDSLGVIEFAHEKDLSITTKSARHPLLGQQMANSWNARFQSEFHMTNDSYLFQAECKKGLRPLTEGKMIHQFIHNFEQPRYWVIEKEARKAVLGRTQDTGQRLDYQYYRLGFRKIARNTDERTMIATIIAPSFHAENFQSVRMFDEDGRQRLSSETLFYLCAVWNSFVLDFFLRLRVTANVNFFYVYQLPIPRLTEKDATFRPIVGRAARLICTTPAFDDLAKEIFGQRSGMGSGTGVPPVIHGRDGHATGKTTARMAVPLWQQYGATEPSERAKLRAELDGLVAHLYGLTEEEFAYILTTFPLVPDAVKIAAHNAFRNVEKGLIK